MSRIDDPLSRRYRKNPSLVTREIAEETLLVPVKGQLAKLQRIFALNPVAAHIWRQLDEERSLRDVHESILDAFDVEPDEARVDMLEFVGSLCASDLILDTAGDAGRDGVVRPEEGDVEARPEGER